MNSKQYLLLSQLSERLFFNKNTLKLEPYYGPESSSSEIVPFPPPNPDWFNGGLPTTVTPSQNNLSGNPIDYIPINLTARVSKDYSFVSQRDSNRFFVRGDEVFMDAVPKKYVHAGDYIVTIMYPYQINYYPMGNLTVTSAGQWRLLQDFGGIDAGSTASQTVSVTSGVNRTTARSISVALGFKFGIAATSPIGNITAEMSTTFTNTFSTSISITSELSTSTTVNYQAQKKAQRIGIYQFYRGYNMAVTNRWQVELDKKFDSSFYDDMILTTPQTPQYYPTNHFQKVFVLDPN